MGLRGVGRGLNFGQALVKVGKGVVKTQDFSPLGIWPKVTYILSGSLSLGASVRTGEGQSLVETATGHPVASRLCAGEGLPYRRLP